MKTLWAIILIFVLTDNLTGQNTRKNTFPIRITVCDSINHEPLFLATISLTQDNHKIIAGSSDAQGEYLFPSVQTGVYKLKVSFTVIKLIPTPSGLQVIFPCIFCWLPIRLSCRKLSLPPGSLMV